MTRHPARWQEGQCDSAVMVDCHLSEARAVNPHSLQWILSIRVPCFLRRLASIAAWGYSPSMSAISLSVSSRAGEAGVCVIGPVKPTALAILANSPL